MLLKNVFLKLSRTETARIKDTEEIRNELTERNQEQGRNEVQYWDTVGNGSASWIFIWCINLKWLRCEWIQTPLYGHNQRGWKCQIRADQRISKIIYQGRKLSQQHAVKYYTQCDWVRYRLAEWRGTRVAKVDDLHMGQLLP